MKKLLSMLGMITIVSSGISPTMAMSNNKIASVQDKINLSSIKIPDYLYNIQGSTDLEAVKVFALKMAAQATGDTVAQSFIDDFLANPSNYTTIGGITELPREGKTLSFTYNIMANSSNPLYAGLTAFTIILENVTSSDKYNLSTIQNIIEKQLAVNSDDIVIDNTSGNVDIETETLKIIDERLVDLGVYMYGFDNLLEMGKESQQLNVIAEQNGDIGADSGFYTTYKIHISINDDSKINNFTGLETPINFFIGVRLKNRIDITYFKELANDFEKNSLSSYKKQGFSTKQTEFNAENVGTQEVLNDFDIYISNHMIDENTPVPFKNEYEKKNFEVDVDVGEFNSDDLSRTVALTFYALDTSNIFLMNGNFISLTYKIYANDYLLSSIPFSFSENREIWEAGWLNDSYTRDEDYKVLKWTNYADNWEEFISKFGNDAADKQTLKFDIYAQAATTFQKGSSLTREGTANLALNNFTTEFSNVTDPEELDLSASEGTSHTHANFSLQYSRDDNYLIVHVHFYLQINCFSKQTTTMEANVGNVRFEAKNND